MKRWVIVPVPSRLHQHKSFANIAVMLKTKAHHHILTNDRQNQYCPPNHPHSHTEYESHNILRPTPDRTKKKMHCTLWRRIDRLGVGVAVWLRQTEVTISHVKVLFPRLLSHSPTSSTQDRTLFLNWAQRAHFGVSYTQLHMQVIWYRFAVINKNWLESAVDNHNGCMHPALRRFHALMPGSEL